MKRMLLLIPMLILTGCSGPSNTADDGTTTESINLTNYQRYLDISVVKAPTYYIDENLLSIKGSLSFAIYDVKITYTGNQDTTTQKGGQETITLNAAGCGTGSIIIYKTNFTINSVVGTVKYKL